MPKVVDKDADPNFALMGQIYDVFKFLPGAAQPLATDANQPGMLLLRAARDESHRFALSRHRRARSRALFQ